ncbi:uncharacterized protein LOC106760357 [Vigna radiata var. radiata]|uniref:Uncharacterized protein LOC106760357 n=1 Tax=Vigna radiata var. radiata TaxID=3916 RepID=A0A1S3TZT6_VIGRR|nr:uncharacterized protein LOC106760357 [Vigna radiata var. radiata]
MDNAFTSSLFTTSFPSSNIIIQQDNSSFSITVILNDSDYPLWSQLMDMRIGARNKSRYLTGIVTKPSIDDPTYDNWVTENKWVKSWLIDSMSPSLMQRFIRLESAHQIWDVALRTFYDGSDETCLFELNQRSFSTKQHGRPLSTYCNELLSIFQEIDHRMSSSETTVNGVVQMHSSMARLRVHIFLSGFLILTKFVERFFVKTQNWILRAHMSMSVVNINNVSLWVVLLLPRIPQLYYLSDYGHSKNRCYEIIGYPTW